MPTKVDYAPSFKFDPLSSDNEFAALDRRYNELSEERTALRIESAALAEQIRSNSSAETNPEARRTEALALGHSYTQEPSRQERLTKITRKISDITDAIDLLRNKKETAARKHSVKVCEKLRPFHDSLVRDSAKALISAQQAAQRLTAFVEKLRDNGITTSSLPDAAPFFLEAANKYSALAVWFDKLAQAGLIERKSIPPELDFRN